MHAGVVSRVIMDNAHSADSLAVPPNRSPKRGHARPSPQVNRRKAPSPQPPRKRTPSPQPPRRPTAASAQQPAATAVGDSSSGRPSPQAGCLHKKKMLVTSVKNGKPDIIQNEAVDESMVLLTPHSKRGYGGERRRPDSLLVPAAGAGMNHAEDASGAELGAPAAMVEDLSDYCDSDESHDPTGGAYSQPPPRRSRDKAGGGGGAGANRRPRVKTERCRRRCACCLQSQTCFVVIYLWIGLFLAACVCALLVVSLLVVRPYVLAERFLPAACRPLTAAHTDAAHTCSCGKGCTSYFPCVEIVVEYSDSEGRVHKGFLREHEGTIKTQCSFYPECKTSRTENSLAVEEYVSEYGTPGAATYNCLYNPLDPGQVIQTRRFKLQDVVHGLVWSSLIMLGALIFLCLAMRRRGCDFV